MLNKEEQDLFYKKLGVLVKAARKNLDYKQEVLSKDTGLTRISIVNIEQGKQKVQLHTLAQIAKCLKIEISDLIPPIDAVLKEISPNMIKKMDKQGIKEGVDKPESKEKLSAFVKISTNK